jgi:CRISPR-associated protein Csh1
MLNTFIKLGEKLSDGRGEWDDIIDTPNVAKEREKGMHLYVAEIILDLDKKDIYIPLQNLKVLLPKDR